MTMLAVLVAFLLYRNAQLGKEIEALKQNQQKEQVNITPVKPGTDTKEQSPFDKPDVDQMARQLPETKEPPALTAITWQRITHDFGRINEGDKVKTTFHFTNSGKNPLIISSAQATCGCTVPNWPKAAIAPGEEADITVVFDSEGKHGQVEKEVTVTANVNPPATILTIKSVIVPRDN